MYSICQQIMSKLFSGLSIFVIVFYFNVLLTTTAVKTTTNQNIGNVSQIIDSNVKNKTDPKTENGSLVKMRHEPKKSPSTIKTTESTTTPPSITPISIETSPAETTLTSGTTETTIDNTMTPENITTTTTTTLSTTATTTLRVKRTTTKGAHTPQEVCSQPQKPGMCRAYFEKWAFNMTVKHCVMFIYGGCKGNQNNFETEEQCKDFCKDFA